MSAAIKRLAVLCAGQGAQADLDFAGLRPNSGQPAAAEASALWQAASQQVGADWQTCWQALTLAERRSNRMAQLAVSLWQGLQWLRWRDHLPSPAWVAGYSAGELAAHAIAGSLAFADLPALMVARAQVMDGACGVAEGPCLVLLGARLPPNARHRRMQALQRHGLQLAIQRSAAEAIWGAPAGRLADFLADAAQDGGWDARPVDVRVPSHTPWLQPALAGWTRILAQTAVQAPGLGVLAGISGEPVRSAAAVRDTLARQIVQPVQWADVLQALGERGITTVLDLGPGTDQSRLLEALEGGFEVLQAGNRQLSPSG